MGDVKKFDTVGIRASAVIGAITALEPFKLPKRSHRKMIRDKIGGRQHRGITKLVHEASKHTIKDIITGCESDD